MHPLFEITWARLLPNLALLCLSLLSLESCEQQARLPVTEESAQTHPLAAGATVQIESACGDIAVSGWDREECRVEAVKRAGNPAELALIVLGIEVHGNRV
jgi:hypothetical protein